MRNKIDDPTFSNRFTHLFQLEILKGCRWNCPGCFVDKEGASWRDGDDKKFLNLCHEFLDRGDYLKDLVIGPTDFMSASNTRAELETETMREIVSLFCNVIFITTLLDNRVEEWGEFLNEYIPEPVTVRFGAIIDPHQFHKPAYLKAVKAKLDLFLKHYKRRFDVSFVFPTTIDDKSAQTYLPRDLLKIQKQVSATFDYNWGNQHGVSFARTSHFQKDRGRIHQHIQWLNHIYEEICENDPDVEVDFPFARIEPSGHFYYAYNRGKWYHTPFIYDELVIHDKEFEIPTPEWKVEEFTKYYDSLIAGQYTKLENKPCEGCHNLAWCSSRYIVDFMDRLDVNECLVPQKAFEYYAGRAWQVRNGR